MRLVIAIDQLGKGRRSQPEVKLVGAGSGQRELIDAGSIEIYAGNDRLERCPAVETGDERYQNPRRQVDRAGHVEHMAGQEGTDVLKPIVQVKDRRVEIVDPIESGVVLERIRDLTLYAASETFCGPHQKAFVSRTA